MNCEEGREEGRKRKIYANDLQMNYHFFLCNIYFTPPFGQPKIRSQANMSHFVDGVSSLIANAKPPDLSIGIMQFKAHKSHMATVGTVAIPHEAGAFTLASLAVPGMQTLVMYLSIISGQVPNESYPSRPLKDTPQVVLPGLLLAIVEGIGSNPQET